MPGRLLQWLKNFLTRDTNPHQADWWAAVTQWPTCWRRTGQSVADRTGQQIFARLELDKRKERKLTWDTQEAGGVTCVISANQQQEEWAHLFLLVSVPRFCLAGLIVSFTLQVN
jgi:hypothetical protein